jgi:hypothetical protein
MTGEYYSEVTIAVERFKAPWGLMAGELGSCIIAHLDLFHA